MKQLQRALIFIFICLCSISLSSFANNETDHATITKANLEADFALQITNNTDMETLIKENTRCIRCHKVKRKIKNIAAIKIQGAHSNKKYSNNCTACHGNKGKHPKDGSNIINFSPKSLTPLLEQNGQCITCHAPTELRQAEWTHDVHYKKINCASCHQLHESVDPIINISRKPRIKLCVDCHSSISTLKAEK
jgi:cytochrome c-type protein NrfB